MAQRQFADYHRITRSLVASLTRHQTEELAHVLAIHIASHDGRAHLADELIREILHEAPPSERSIKTLRHANTLMLQAMPLVVEYRQPRAW